MLISAALATAGVGIVLPAEAATYELGPGKPYAELAEVWELLVPGDVVELQGDHTYAGGVSFWHPGTRDQPIIVRGIPKNGRRPVISGGTNTIEAGGNHYIFESLELTGGSFRCFYHHADDIVLRDAIVHDCPKHGVLGGDTDSGSLLMEYVEVYGCGEGTQNHQIYMATDETMYPGSVFRMQHCYVHDGNGGNNVKTRAERNEIYYNWIEGAMYHEIELIGPDGQDPGLAREDSDVVGNVIVKTAPTFVARFGGDGTGDTNGRYRFVNNTVVVQPGGSAVFRLFDGIESMSVHNNVFYTLGGGPLDMIREAEAAWASGAAVISGSNNWVPDGSANVPSSWSGTVGGSDPGFIDVDGMDLRLADGSMLIDAAAATMPDPSGYAFPDGLGSPGFAPPLHLLEAVDSAAARAPNGALDIGAFELGSPAPGPGSGSGTPGGGAGAGDGDPGEFVGGGDASSDGGCQVSSLGGRARPWEAALGIGLGLGAVLALRRRRPRR